MSKVIPYGLDDVQLMAQNKGHQSDIDAKIAYNKALKSEEEFLAKQIAPPSQTTTDYIYGGVVYYKLLALNNLIKLNTYKSLSKGMISDSVVEDTAINMYNELNQEDIKIVDNKDKNSLIDILPSSYNKVIKPKF